jgi:hypothetical protein
VIERLTLVMKEEDRINKIKDFFRFDLSSTTKIGNDYAN